MSATEDVLNELESIGAIGDKVVQLRAPRAAAEAPPEPETSEDSPEEMQRERISILSLRAATKLASLAEAVQDLQKVFQELHEATREGESHEELQEEA